MTNKFKDAQQFEDTNPFDHPHLLANLLDRTNPVHRKQIRDLILNDSYSSREAKAYVHGNIIEVIENTGKGILSLLEFMKQTIGHQKLDTTSAYVNKLSNQEKQERIS